MRNNRSALRSPAPMTLTKSCLPVVVVAKYGALPRASTSGTRSDCRGKPAPPRAPATSWPVGRGLGALRTNRMALPSANPSANSKNAVAGSTDDESTRATTTRPRALHQTFLHLGPVVHTRTVTIVVAMPTDPGSSHTHFPATLLFAT